MPKLGGGCVEMMKFIKFLKCTDSGVTCRVPLPISKRGYPLPAAPTRVGAAGKGYPLLDMGRGTLQVTPESVHFRNLMNFIISTHPPPNFGKEVGGGPVKL